MEPKQTPPTMTIRTKPKTIQPIPTAKSFTTTETKPTQNKTYNLDIFWRQRNQAKLDRTRNI